MQKKENFNKLIFESIEHLDRWLAKNGWQGWDPYDIKGIPFFLWLQKRPQFFLKKIVLDLMLLSSEIFPKAFRNIFSVKPTINAKAMGLFTSSYSIIYSVTGEKMYIEKAKECGEWLLQNYSRGYSGLGWGYPFDWQSIYFIPKYTPSSVVSSIVGDGLWSLYKVLKEKKYLSACLEICDFFLKNLNVSFDDGECLCFSYTPIDDYQVHNANLFVGEFLIRVGQEVGNKEWMNKGLRCGLFAARQQNKDGSLCYWGRDQQQTYSKGICHIDHYHSGFEIRNLYSIWKLTDDENIYKTLKDYYRFYLDNLFINATIPKMTPKKEFPIDIHSCAEAILCSATLIKDFPQSEKYCMKSAKWTIENMQTDEGWFICAIRKIMGVSWKSKIAYIRWGQGWMLRALAEALVSIDYLE